MSHGAAVSKAAHECPKGSDDKDKNAQGEKDAVDTEKPEAPEAPEAPDPKESEAPETGD
jgi:hypothetical protein